MTFTRLHRDLHHDVRLTCITSQLKTLRLTSPRSFTLWARHVDDETDNIFISSKFRLIDQQYSLKCYALKPRNFLTNPFRASNDAHPTSSFTDRLNSIGLRRCHPLTKIISRACRGSGISRILHHRQRIITLLRT